jgi:hypothetical protein
MTATTGLGGSGWGCQLQEPSGPGSESAGPGPARDCGASSIAAVTGPDSEYQPQLMLRAPGRCRTRGRGKGDGARRGAARAGPSSLSSSC